MQALAIQSKVHAFLGFFHQCVLTRIPALDVPPIPADGALVVEILRSVVGQRFGNNVGATAGAAVGGLMQTPRAQALRLFQQEVPMRKGMIVCQDDKPCMVVQHLHIA